MDHAAFVGMLQPEGGLANIFAGFGHWEGAAFGGTARQADAVDVFHRQKMNLACLLGVEGGDDIRMREASGGPDLATKPLDGRRLVGEFAIEDFEGYRPLHEEMLRPIDSAHAADAEQLSHSI